MRQKIIKTPKQSVPFVITGIQKTTLTEQNLIAFSGQYKILSREPVSYESKLSPKTHGIVQKVSFCSSL